MLTPHQELIANLATLDFIDKGEAFVEARFLTPLLGCLGYESHKDYEVIRHGDDSSGFRLKYPPVEKGAVRVKHYNPDYVPTIRKKMFWIVEAKSPKDVGHPFDGKNLVQGLQYCIHPEIQAKYLVVTNGIVTDVYDAHGAVFFDQDMYAPILEFKASEISQSWPQIYALLSVETLRTRIEVDLKAMFDKLCLSSLDKNYPQALLHRMGASTRESAKKIEKHVATLNVTAMEQEAAAWRSGMERLDARQILFLMNLPLRPGNKTEATYFVEKSVAAGTPLDQIFAHLTHNFERQSIFRKEQTFVGLCALYHRVVDPATKTAICTFLDKHKDGNLPVLNQLECGLLRLLRKVAVVSMYPELRKHLAQELQSAPELARFVQTPTALTTSYAVEILMHENLFKQISAMSDEQCQERLCDLLKTEAGIEEDFKVARARLTDAEKQIGGFEWYGLGGKHYAFKNILHNFGIELREDLS